MPRPARTRSGQRDAIYFAMADVHIMIWLDLLGLARFEAVETDLRWWDPIRDGGTRFEAVESHKG